MELKFLAGTHLQVLRWDVWLWPLGCHHKDCRYREGLVFWHPFYFPISICVRGSFIFNPTLLLGVPLSLFLNFLNSYLLQHLAEELGKEIRAPHIKGCLVASCSPEIQRTSLKKLARNQLAVHSKKVPMAGCLPILSSRLLSYSSLLSGKLSPNLVAENNKHVTSYSFCRSGIWEWLNCVGRSQGVS